MQKKHSGKMGAIALPVALIAAAVGALLWMLTGAQGYRAADWTDTDGQRYYRNMVTHQAFAADAEKDYPNAKIVDCTVTLRLGRNVKALNEVSCFGWQGYDENGAETVWRLRWNVECDEENETFYAKGGRLYRCADGEAVEAFRCA